jgi:hypothetical protein
MTCFSSGGALHPLAPPCTPLCCSGCCSQPATCGAARGCPGSGLADELYQARPLVPQVTTTTEHRKGRNCASVCEPHCICCGLPVLATQHSGSSTSAAGLVDMAHGQLAALKACHKGSRDMAMELRFYGFWSGCSYLPMCHVHRAELQWQRYDQLSRCMKGPPACSQMQACCRRNVHPTTRLLQPFNGSSGIPPGMLIVSSASLLLCSMQQQQQLADASSSSAAAAAMPGSYEAVKQQLGTWRLSGRPVSWAALTPQTFILGCDSTGEAGTVDLSYKCK